MPRHLETCHSNESEVAQALAFPLNSTERRAAFARIRREGDYSESVSNLKVKSKAIAVRRNKNDDEVSPCPQCFGFFKARFLWRHAEHCPAQILAKEPSQKPGHNILKNSRVLLAASVINNERHRDVMEGIISKMNQDVYTLIIKTDPLLLTYAAILMERDGLRRKGEISYKLKSLAKLLEKGQELSKNANLAAKDLIDPKKWDLMVQSVKVLTGYDEAEIEVPSLFVKLGYALQHLARVARSMGLRTEDDSLIKKCNNFLELYESEWNVYTTRVRIQFDNNRNKAPQNLPLAKDIKLL